LQDVWAEKDCQLDVCRIIKGGRIEHLRGSAKKKSLGEFFLPSVGSILTIFPAVQCTDFMKRVRELRKALYSFHITVVQFYLKFLYDLKGSDQKCTGCKKNLNRYGHTPLLIGRFGQDQIAWS
jgi:hypothetical protein